MQKSIETTGKTIDLAVKAAMDTLGLDRDSISVEVLENAKSGFFGIGAAPARIRATYEAPDNDIADEPEAPKPALSSASRNKKPSKFALRQAEKQAEEAERAAAAEAAAKQAAEEQKPTAAAKQSSTHGRQQAPRGERHEKTRRVEAKKPAETKPNSAAAKPLPETKRQTAASEIRDEPVSAEIAPAAPGSTEEKINTFLNGLMQHMGANAHASTVRVDGDTYKTELIGENLGVLIGRRGDTLDAIQHLTNYCLNRSGKGHIRINVDAENYRAKREESLQRLAEKVAAKVVRYRRNITLEPMNAYERHVIHAALQEYADVTTYSTGTEPNRRIVVAYSRYKSTPAGK